ncbi:MAG: aspartate/glutamate racemase family protein [Thaumarchaeota archaeon]|nr:aspartate/glutamate racemase family protein [Nitrososphaerota archaeon]
MARIAVFDSGLGSISIIKPIQKKIRTEIVYFADQDSFPYGTKSARELKKVIRSTVRKLEENFSPDLIVVASNTPSLLIDPERHSKIIGVYPPLKDAAKKTATGTIAVLATRSVVKSRKLQDYIRCQVHKKIKVITIDVSPLVDLVESGKFISEKEFCRKRISAILQPIQERKVDVATLSSTHLPFLLPILKEVFPNVTFLDPADSVADRVAIFLKNKKSKRHKLEIFASGNAKDLQRKLQKIGIRNKVLQL